jgi:WD40 repeat protein
VEGAEVQMKIDQSWAKVVASLLLCTPTFNLAQETDNHPFLRGDDCHSACFAGNDVLLTASSAGEICAWDLKTAKLQRRLRLGREAAYGIVVTGDSQIAGVISGYDHIVLIDVAKWRMLSTIIMPADVTVSKLTITPDKKHVLSACSDGKVRIHEIQTGQEIRTLSPDHSTASMPSRLKIEARGSQPRFLPNRECPDAVDVAISVDGKYIAAAYSRVWTLRDKQVQVWDMATFKPTYAYRIDASYARSVAFHPTMPHTLAMPGRDDKSVCLWDLGKTQAPTLHVNLPSSAPLIRYSPDGSAMICKCDDGAIRLIRGSEKPKVLLQFSPQHDGLYQMSFSPDSKLLAIRLYNSKENLDKIFVVEVSTGKSITPRK